MFAGIFSEFGGEDGVVGVLVYLFFWNVLVFSEKWMDIGNYYNYLLKEK